MTEWNLHFDPWTAGACDIAQKMDAIERAYKSKQGWSPYHAGTDGKKDTVLLEYDTGTLDLWLLEFDDEDVPKALAILAPLRIALVEVESTDGFRRSFDQYDISDLVKNRPFEKIVHQARQMQSGGRIQANPDELECFKKAWADFKTAIGYDDYEPETD